MHLKDYYAILQVAPSASLQEIKKAYRKLALQHHPDKNHNDPYAASLFTEIKEAYEVLTDPSKKEYYLQRRWYEQSIGKRTKQDIITPVTVLKQALELERHVSGLDVFRMDKQGLKDFVLGLLPGSTIEKLHAFNEPESIRTIISTILKAIHPLPKAYTGEILESLQQLAGSDTIALQDINAYSSKASRKHRREQFSLIIIIAATLILCLLIWLGGR